MMAQEASFDGDAAPSKGAASGTMATELLEEAPIAGLESQPKSDGFLCTVAYRNMWI